MAQPRRAGKSWHTKIHELILMQNTGGRLLNYLFNLVIPKKALQWDRRKRYSEEVAEEEVLFCQRLIDSEPTFDFARHATKVRALPESADNSGPAWLDMLSDAARSYLSEIDRIYAENPSATLKLVAIIAAIVPRGYQLQTEASKRMCYWLQQTSIPDQTRIELGLLLQSTWPESLTREAIEIALLDLLVTTSERNPAVVADSFREKLESENGSPPYLIHFGEDPVKLLAIGRNVARHYPDLSKFLFGRLLFAARLEHFSVALDEAEIRAVAQEFFDMLCATPSPDPVRRGWHYANLSQWAYTDVDWYPQVLDELLKAAATIDDRERAAHWNVTVALNADRDSAVFANAMAAYGQYLSQFRSLNDAEPFDRGVDRFTKLLLGVLETALKDKVVVGRNISIPPQPTHPVVLVTRDAYWEFVDWLNALPSARVLHALGEAISGEDEPLAETAGEYLSRVFAAQARRDADLAADVLGNLARYEHYSGVPPARKSRCLGLVKRLMPQLAKISPKAVALAQERGKLYPDWFR